MSTTESVLDHHLEAFGSQNLKETMADYSESAVLITHGETFRGHEEITGVFEDFFAEFSQDGVDFSLEEKRVEDDYAYIVWNADTPENSYDFATDTFVIRDGEIVAQTIGTVVDPKD
ncbi:nuclear transport factor 2 family protein [Halobacteriales archaeon QS_8_65_32]|jgi:ketosteroid isomerase-like protein|nr:MAG: nuclear transport factor 2 family protein [Halobacteriales archaeon QS_8_65_32]